MPTYPTELRHGSGGYRRGAMTGLSNGSTISPEAAFLAPAAGPLAQYGHGVAVGETVSETALRGWLSRFPLVSRVAPIAAAGFLGGWELGAYLLGRDDLSIVWGPLAPWTVGQPGGNVNEPENWSSSDWLWDPCPVDPGGEGPTKYWITNFATQACAPSFGFPQFGGMYDTPEDAAAAITTHLPNIEALRQGTPGIIDRKVGEWVWIDADNDGLKGPWTYTPPALVPGFYHPAEPWVSDPDSLPIMQPVTNPVPKPFGDAVADPATQPSVPEEVTTRVGTITQPFVLPPFPTNFPTPLVVVPPVVPVGGGVAPVVAPDVIIQPSPSGGLDVIQVPPGTTLPPEPPGPKKKERKITVRTAVGVGVHTALNVVTESFDFVDSLYKGIQEIVPREQWCSNHDYTCKLTQLYEHWDDPNFDAAKWVSAFINNQFEDAVYGRLGTLTGRATGNLNITTGLNRALGEGQEQVGNLGEHFEGDDGEEFEHVGLLPELTIDENGITFDWEVMGIEIDFET